MSSSTLIRWGGPAAMLRGVLFVVGATLTFLQPAGCVASECDLPGRSMRTGTVSIGVISITAILLIGFGALALAARAHGAGRLGRSGRIGLVAALVAGGAVLLASLVQAAFFASDFPYMPLVVIPGGLAVALGFLLFGLGILRGRVLPRWAGALLVVGTLAMLGFNE